MRKIFSALTLIVLFFSISALLHSQDVTPHAEVVYEGLQKKLDYIWVMAATALVFLMQLGFMALESGLSQAKHSINVAIKNMGDFILGVLGFWLIGFGIMFGESFMGLGLFGWGGGKDFLIDTSDNWRVMFFLFQAVFVGTAATIDSGAICGRAKFKHYIFLSFLVSVIIYPVFGHWAWGSFLNGTTQGWLEKLGFLDFAGSTVVHSVGAWMALAGVIVLGPRIGKFDENGKARKIQANDMTLVFTGVFILFFGWFGFNAGSTLSATEEIAPITLNTTLSAVFAAMSASVLSYVFHPEKKIEAEMIANGVLAGLVGITAGCYFVDTVGAAIIGFVAGILVYVSSYVIENVFKLDDAVGAIPVHGVCGVWGTIALAFFMKEEHIMEGHTRLYHIGIQSLGVLAAFVWTFSIAMFVLFIMKKFFKGVRVSVDDEQVGLNVAEHGAKSSILDLAGTIYMLTQTGKFNEESKVEVETGTEIGDLANLFNQMIEKVRLALKESEEQKARANDAYQKAQNLLRESQEQHQIALDAKKSAEDSKTQIENERKESQAKRVEYITNTKDKVSEVVNKANEMANVMFKTTEMTEGMTKSFDELIETIQSMLKSIDEVYTEINDVKEVTTGATTEARVTQNAVEVLNKTAVEIGEIVQFINDIASKTHVLSINSGIEAAKAGEAGRGFVVVSKEVQSLSDKTGKAAHEISERIKDIQNQIQTVVTAMNRVLNTITQIGDINFTIMKSISANKEITRAMHEEAGKTSAEINKVSEAISFAFDEAESVSKIGKHVSDELDTIE